MVVPKTLRASDIEPERIRRLWGNYLFLGKVNVIDGDPGLGKSTVIGDIGARVTTYRPMSDGSRSDLGGPTSVLILSAEDGAGDTIRNRLEAAGADLERVIVWDCNIDDDGSELLRSLPEDIGLMADLIQRHNVALVTIDPIMAHLGAKTYAGRWHRLPSSVKRPARLSCWFDT
jgi:hypothetical protein